MVNQNPIDEMILALDENINYLKRQGNSHIRISNGNLIKNINDLYIYEFELEFLQNIDEDADIELKIKSESSNGKIISLSNNIIQVSIDKYLGDEIHEATLIISNYYLLQILKEKLNDVKNGVIKLTELPYKTFNISKFDNKFENYSIPNSAITELPNITQKNAINLALGSEVTYIWGPPGTGKTQTIARIIEGFLTKDFSVLLIAHTNIATDGALFYLVKHLRGSDDYLEGKFLREGVITKSELKEYPLVDPEKVIDSKGEAINIEIKRLNNEIEKNSLNIKKYEAIINKSRKLVNINNEIENISGDISNKEKKIHSLEKTLDEVNSKIREVDEKIRDYQSKGKLGKIFSRMNLEKLMNEKSKLLTYKTKIEDSITQNTDVVNEGKSKLDKYREDKKQIENELQGIDLDSCSQILDKVRKETENLNEQKTSLSKKLDELANSVFKEAKVIATTLTKSYTSNRILTREYDCIIIDEASMASLPSLWYAAGLAKNKVVIVGDFYQLPPIVKYRASKERGESDQDVTHKEKLVNNWLKTNIFKKSGIVSTISSGNTPKCMQQLKVQYRMHPEIANIVNSLVYCKNGKQFELESAENTYNNGIELLDQEPLINSHVGIYDTSKVGTFATRTDSRSYYNLYHALIAVNLSVEALNSGYTDIGIISPFRAQTNLIKKILEDQQLNYKVEADTVHRFQGGEKQIIIFDTTTPLPTQLTDDLEEGGDDEKLLNVAFSRAKEKLLLISDVHKLESKHSKTSLLKKFIQLCRDKKFPIISTEDYLPRYEISDKEEEWLAKITNIQDIIYEINSSTVFTQNDFYKKFTKDLLEAKKEVIIDSPYITTKRAMYFMQIFNYLLSKNIKIFIFTRLPTNSYSLMDIEASKEIQKFEHMGITVLPFKGKPHRKLAIVDRTIHWEGSLNILSQRRSGEIMRRFDGKETASEMMKLLKWDKNIGELGENKLQRCESCKDPGAWYWTSKSRFGDWTHCLVGNHQPGKRPQSREEKERIKREISDLRRSKKQKTSEGTPICPKHKIKMVKKNGRYGEFWGCPKYPACRITENIN